MISDERRKQAESAAKKQWKSYVRDKACCTEHLCKESFEKGVQWADANPMPKTQEEEFKEANRQLSGRGILVEPSTPTPRTSDEEAVVRKFIDERTQHPYEEDIISAIRYGFQSARRTQAAEIERLKQWGSEYKNIAEFKESELEKLRALLERAMKDVQLSIKNTSHDWIEQPESETNYGGEHDPNCYVCGLETLMSDYEKLKG